MIKIKDLKECCGCTACASICAHDAIKMEPDVLGFLYPKVDESKCVNCGLCEKVCQFNENYDRSLNLPRPVAYAARHKDINEVMKSRSGAAFVAISDYILEQGGVVYGAGYKDHFRVVHKRAVTKDERDEFRGSKYVQSDLTGVFRQVREDLKNGLIVLFSGTPCQTSGLSAYVGKKFREMLYLIDIVCFGVPGPYVWRDYLAYLERRHGSKIIYVNFRDKELYGWRAHKETFRFENERSKIHSTEGYFSHLYNLHIMSRKSCGICYYTNLQRPSDITLADFWHSNNIDPELNADDKGMSLIWANTEKGVLLLNTICRDFSVFRSVDINKVLQRALYEPFPAHKQRDEFERCYIEFGFEYTCQKYTKVPLLKYLRQKIRKWKNTLLFSKRR